jgi:LacI family transcriptional regulator
MLEAANGPDAESIARPLQRSTMRDVAALADVSVKTVSRVINGEKYVSPAVAEKVNMAVLRLNYRHNLAASQLRAGSNASAIGLILVDISNPFSSTVHRVVQDVLQASGIAVLSASTDEEAARERAAVRAFSERRVDGLIIMPASHDQSYLQSELSAGMHIVMIDRPPAFLHVDSVTSDNRGGAMAGVQHLIEQGHRRIGFVGDWPDISSSRLRYEGYQDALSRAGIALAPEIVLQGFNDQDIVMNATRELLSAPDAPTAVFVAQNALCAPVVRAVRGLDRRYAVAVVGFDGFEGADLVEPGLTVVAQDPVQMGRHAAQILLGRLHGDEAPPQNELLATHLINRGSGEIAGPYSSTRIES